MDGSVLKSTSPSKLLLIDNILRFGWSLRKSYQGFQTEPNESRNMSHVGPALLGFRARMSTFKFVVARLSVLPLWKCLTKLLTVTVIFVWYENRPRLFNWMSSKFKYSRLRRKGIFCFRIDGERLKSRFFNCWQSLRFGFKTILVSDRLLNIFKPHLVQYSDPCVDLAFHEGLMCPKNHQLAANVHL